MSDIMGSNMKEVLGNGYVRLVDSMGSDLSVVNSARVSYNKAVDELSEKDIKLIKFLAREGHTSPFRHATLQFEVYCNLFTARQWFKYVVGSATQDTFMAWNESSRRYITEEPEFYIPEADSWRSKPNNSKQGSGHLLPMGQGLTLTAALENYIKFGEALYNEAIEKFNVAPEMARLFLPANAMMVRFYWTASLAGVAHFLNQRLAHDAQFEIQEFARAVDELARPIFPHSLEELVKTA